MGVLKKGKKQNTNKHTGFGSNAANYGGRFINKDGSANIKKVGIGIIERTSWYHTMLNIKRWKFMLTIFVFYGVVNFLFACIYCPNMITLKSIFFSKIFNRISIISPHSRTYSTKPNIALFVF